MRPPQPPTYKLLSSITQPAADNECFASLSMKNWALHPVNQVGICRHVRSLDDSSITSRTGLQGFKPTSSITTLHEFMGKLSCFRSRCVFYKRTSREMKSRHICRKLLKRASPTPVHVPRNAVSMRLPTHARCLLGQSPCLQTV